MFKTIFMLAVVAPMLVHGRKATSTTKTNNAYTPSLHSYGPLTTVGSVQIWDMSQHDLFGSVVNKVCRLICYVSVQKLMVNQDATATTFGIACLGDYGIAIPADTCNSMLPPLVTQGPSTLHYTLSATD